MKHRLAILASVLLCVSIGFLLRQSTETTEFNRDAVGMKNSTMTNGNTVPSPPADPLEEQRKLGEKMLREREEARERALNEYRTPINFYGRVVSETGEGIEGAHVEFGWTDLSLPDGYSKAQISSGSDGLFSLEGKTGNNLSVRISKDGYYTSKSNRISFAYAGANVNFVPNREQPVIFYLRKQGQGEPVVAVSKSFRIPKDGTPVFIDLITQIVVPSTDSGIKVECWTGMPQQRGGEFDWKCRLSVPGGGLQPNTNEFGFLAPEGGYLESDEIDMVRPTPTRWQRTVTRRYFVRTGDGRYGRLAFEMIAGGDHYCYLQTILNPSGSRNLEPMR